MSNEYIASIDQGTSSTRVLLLSSSTFDLLASHQIEHPLHRPHPGFSDIDPLEVLANTIICLTESIRKGLLIDPNLKVVSIGMYSIFFFFIIYFKYFLS